MCSAEWINEEGDIDIGAWNVAALSQAQAQETVVAHVREDVCTRTQSVRIRRCSKMTTECQIELWAKELRRPQVAT